MRVVWPIGWLSSFWKSTTLQFSPQLIISKAPTAPGWLSMRVQPALLRHYLDSAGAGNVPIFYSLAVSYAAFRAAEERGAIIERLAQLPIDCLWIKVSQSGAPTHAAVRNLVNGAAEFHSLGVPLIGDMMGGLRGLSALAFGSVGGNMPRRDAEGRVQRKFIDAAREVEQQGVHAAHKNIRGSLGRSSDKGGGNGVLWGTWLEVPIRAAG